MTDGLFIRKNYSCPNITTNLDSSTGCLCSVQSNTALRADLVILFHQETDPKEGKTNQEHHGEDYPAAGADLAACVWRLIRAAVRAFVLSGILIAHWRSSLRVRCVLRSAIPATITPSASVARSSSAVIRNMPRASPGGRWATWSGEMMM